MSNKTQQAIRVANDAFDILSRIDDVIDETIDLNKKVRNQRIAENVDFLMQSSAEHFRHNGSYEDQKECGCELKSQSVINFFGEHYYVGITSFSDNDIEALEYTVSVFGSSHRSVFNNISYSTVDLIDAYKTYKMTHPNDTQMSLSYVCNFVQGHRIYCLEEV